MKGKERGGLAHGRDETGGKEDSGRGGKGMGRGRGRKELDRKWTVPLLHRERTL